MNKMTYAQAIEIAINEMTNEEAKNRLEELKASLEKRNNKESKKAQERRTENAGLKETLLSELTMFDNPLTISEIISASEHFNGLTPQRLTPIMTQLVEERKVNRIYSKHRAYFQIAREE